MADDIRLPTPGRDHGSWGDMLNTFLAVAHKDDGTLKSSQGVGDCIQLIAEGQTVATHTGAVLVSFDKSLTSIGASLAWDPKDKQQIRVKEAGIYAISVSVDWRDSSSASSARSTEIFINDRLHAPQQYRSSSGTVTKQSLSLTAGLAADETIRVTIEQASGNDLQPEVRVLVTKIAHIVA